MEVAAMGGRSVTPQNLQQMIIDAAKRYEEELRVDLIEPEFLKLVCWANASNENNAIFVEQVLNALFDPVIDFPELARLGAQHLQRADLHNALSKRLADATDERTRACLRSILRAPDKCD